MSQMSPLTLFGRHDNNEDCHRINGVAGLFDWIPLWACGEWNFVVLYGSARAAGINTNDEKIGMLCGNYIYIVGQIKL